MRSLQTRLFLAIMLVAAAALIAVGVFSTHSTALQLERLPRPDDAGVPSIVMRRAQSWYATHHSWSGVDVSFQTPGTNILLFSPEGRLLAASFPGLNRATLTNGRESGLHLAIDPTDRFAGQQHLVLRNLPSALIFDAHHRVVARLFAVPLSPPPRREPAIIFGRELWLAILCALAGALFAAAMLARNILAPVRALSEVTAAMHSGDLSRRVGITGPEEIVQLARRFNALAAHLERSEMLRRRMIADIAHELRTPLTNIRAMTEAVEDGHLSASPSTLGSLTEEALLLERLVNDLQDLSLADAGQLTFQLSEVSVLECVRAVIASLRPAAHVKHITISQGVTAESRHVRADEARLRQILSNLLSNAIRLAPEHSAILITVEDAPGAVRVSVRDEGPGLSADALEAVFERFYRADESRSRLSGGAGLGLAIAKELVEAHRGTIGVSNNEGAGATFSFSLPVSTA